MKELNQVIGQKTVLELSNKLQTIGIEDICDFGNLDEALETGSLIVMNKTTEETYEIYIDVLNKAENILDWELDVTRWEEY